MAFNFVFNKIWDTLWFCVLYSLICSSSVFSRTAENPWNAHMDKYLELSSDIKLVLKDGVFGKWNDCFYKVYGSICTGKCIPITNGRGLLGDSPARCEDSLNKPGDKDKLFWGNFFTTPGAGEVPKCVKFFEVPDCILKKSGYMAFSFTNVVNEAVVPSICETELCYEALSCEANHPKKTCDEDPECCFHSNNKDKCCGTMLTKCCEEGQWKFKYNGCKANC